MKTTIETTEGKALVTFEGMLDSYIAEQVGEDLQPLYELENTEITLDCTKLEYIASSGLRLFILLLRYASQHGCSVCVKGANPLLMSIFEATGFKALFRFVD
jgi:anti-anti-sigma factor